MANVALQRVTKDNKLPLNMGDHTCKLPDITLPLNMGNHTCKVPDILGIRSNELRLVLRVCPGISFVQHENLTVL